MQMHEAIKTVTGTLHMRIMSLLMQISVIIKLCWIIVITTK